MTFLVRKSLISSILFLSLLSSGCFTRYVPIDGYQVVYDIPERTYAPTHPSSVYDCIEEPYKEELFDYIWSLQAEVMEYRTIISEHNARAMQINEWNEYQLRAPWHEKLFRRNAPTNPHE